MSMNKLEIYSSGKRDADVDAALQKEFDEMGIEIKTKGLYRLLGAPIGSTMFLVAVEGHLQKVVDKTKHFLSLIDQMRHTWSKHLMIRYCGSTTMQHLARLISPYQLHGFAAQLSEALFESLALLLATDTLSPIQRSQASLPDNRGGLGYVSAEKVLHAAFLGSAGDVARWYATEPWPEAQVY